MKSNSTIGSSDNSEICYKNDVKQQLSTRALMTKIKLLNNTYFDNCYKYTKVIEDLNQKKNFIISFKGQLDVKKFFRNNVENLRILKYWKSWYESIFKVGR